MALNGSLAGPSEGIVGPLPYAELTTANLVVGSSAIALGTNKGLLYDNSGVLGNLATANNGVLITSGAGAPSIGSTLPAAVQGNITAVGTLASGVVPSSLVTGLGALATLGVGTGLSSSGGNLNIANQISAAGPIGTATAAPVITYNAQGQLTTVTTITITPAWASIVGPPTTLAGYGITSPLNPVQGGTGVASPTAHGIAQSEGASAFSFIAAATAGNIIIDQGAGADWLSKTILGDAALSAAGALTVTKTGGVSFGALATLGVGTGLSSGGGNLNISNQIAAAGPIGSATAIPVVTYNAQGQLTTVTTATPTVTAVNGIGYPASPYVVGDILYASTTTAMSRLADFALGRKLTSGGVGLAPSWNLQTPANPVDFGADPTGIADSSAAVSAACGASQYVKFPAGTFLFSTAFPSSQCGGTTTPYWIQGSGAGNTVLKWGAGQSGGNFMFFGNGNYADGHMLTDLTIEGNGANQNAGTGFCLLVDGVIKFKLDRVIIQNCYQTAVSVEDHLAGSNFFSGLWAHQSTVVNWGTSGTGHGISIGRYVYDVVLDTMDILGGPTAAGNHGIKAYNTANPIRIVNSNIDTNGTLNVSIDTTEFLIIANTSIHCGTQCTDGLLVTNASTASLSNLNFFAFPGKALHITNTTNSAVSNITVDSSTAASIPVSALIEDGTSDYNTFGNVTTRGTFSGSLVSRTGSHSKIIGATYNGTSASEWMGPIATTKIGPQADGMTALQITKADLSTSIVNIDTTNARVGIGSGFTTPGYTFDLRGSSNFQATSGNTLVSVTDGSVTNTWGFLAKTDGNGAIYDQTTGVLAIQIAPTTDVVTINSTTDATSTATGSLQAKGGFVALKRVWHPGLTTAAGILAGGAYICQNSSGEMIADTVSCLASTVRLKEDFNVISDDQSLRAVLSMTPKSWRYIREPDSVFHTGFYRERIGFIAEDLADIDRRLVDFDNDGFPRADDYNAVVTLMAGAIRALKQENNELKLRIEHVH